MGVAEVGVTNSNEDGEVLVASGRRASWERVSGVEAVVEVEEEEEEEEEKCWKKIGQWKRDDCVTLASVVACSAA